MRKALLVFCSLLLVLTSLNAVLWIRSYCVRDAFVWSRRAHPLPLSNPRQTNAMPGEYAEMSGEALRGQILVSYHAPLAGWATVPVRQSFLYHQSGPATGTLGLSRTDAMV